MKLKRVMLAAPGSGSGKTTVTCALLQTLKRAGYRVVSYKCGPDYIDPMFHQKALDVPSRNLDTFFTGEEGTLSLFLKDRTEEDFAVLEGVMGLFDGLGGVRREGSSYHLADVTKTPVILVVNAKGMGRSVLALLAGFLAYDKERLIRGVILNRTSEASYALLAPLIEEELHIRALGYLPDRKRFHIESRHLGLTTPDALAHMKPLLREIAEEFAKTVSVPDIVRIAEEAAELEEPEELKEAAGSLSAPANMDKTRSARPLIAVARDEAFCFYYEDNLRLLREYGAEIGYFSPLRSRGLPEGCSGLLLGGGYPELYAEELSENAGMRSAVKKAFEAGMPVVAECGGFLYLHDTLEDMEGRRFAMAGAFPYVCRSAGRLVRFGYVELSEQTGHFLAEGERIRGHEFHYYDSENNGAGCLAQKPATGKTYPCVMTGASYWAGFPHLYYPSNPRFARRFVEKAGRYRKISPFLF